MASKIVPHSQFLSLVYHDLFDYPLNSDELWLWQVGKDKAPRHQVESLGTFSFLPDRKDVLLKRASLIQENTERLKGTFGIASLIKFIPTIEMIGITAPSGLSRSPSLVLIISPGALWVTRTIVWFLLRMFGRKTLPLVYPTAFFDRNIYTAHELLQIQVLFDRGNVYKRFLQENRWLEQFFPNAFRKHWEGSKRKRKRLGMFSTVVTAVLRVIEWVHVFLARGKGLIDQDEALTQIEFLQRTVPEVFLARLERISKGILAAKQGEFLGPS